MGIGDSGGMSRGPTSQGGLDGLTEGSSTEQSERKRARSHDIAFLAALNAAPVLLLPTSLEGYVSSLPEPLPPYRLAGVQGLYSGKGTMSDAQDEAIFRIVTQAQELKAQRVVDVHHSISHGSDTVAYSLWGTAIIPLK